MKNFNGVRQLFQITLQSVTKGQYPMKRIFAVALALAAFFTTTGEAATVQLSTQGPAIKQALDNIGAVGGQNAATLSVGTISASDLIQVGQSTKTCITGTYGSIRWNPGNNTIQQCNSTGWTNVPAGAISSLTNGGSSIAVNSNNTINFATNGATAASINNVGLLTALNGVNVTGPVTTSGLTTANGGLTVTGALTAGNGISSSGLISAASGINATGTVTATAFVGDGSGLTNLPISAAVSASGVAGNMAYFTASNTLNGTPLIQVSNGLIGVGLAGATPSATFHVSGSIILGNGQFGTDQINALTSLSQILPTSRSPWINTPIVYNLSNGTPVGITLAKVGTTGSGINFAGINVASGVDASLTMVSQRGLLWTSAGTWTSSSTPYRLRITTVPVGSNIGVERITVSDGGFVGISNTAPLAALDSGGSSIFRSDLAVGLARVSAVSGAEIAGSVSATNFILNRTIAAAGAACTVTASLAWNTVSNTIARCNGATFN